MPLVLLLAVAEVVVEFVEDLVDIHDLINLFLFPLDLNTLFHNEVFSVSQLLNCLGSLHDFVLDELEGIRELDSVFLCDLSNKSNLLFTDLLILCSVSSPNILAVDEEHANLDLHWDALQEPVLILDLLEDILADLSGSRRGLALTLLSELGHIFVRVEIVLS